MDSHHLTYTGGPLGLRMLVSDLQAEGLEVDWTPPQERRDLDGIREAATTVELVVKAAAGAGTLIAAAIRRFRERRRGEVDWREENGYR